MSIRDESFGILPSLAIAELPGDNAYSLPSRSPSTPRGSLPPNRLGAVQFREYGHAMGKEFDVEFVRTHCGI